MSCLEYGEDVGVLVSIVSYVVLVEFAQEILVVPAQEQTLLKAYIYVVTYFFRAKVWKDFMFGLENCLLKEWSRAYA
jgi:hypothetical protein